MVPKQTIGCFLESIGCFDEDKSLMLVFVLIESEAVLAKITFILPKASYSSKLDFLHILSIKHDKQSVVYTKQSVVSISSSGKHYHIRNF